MSKVVILDCYTDEPSGYGVRPYLGTHQIHLSQALSHLRIDHTYITIDDLRYAHGTRSIDIDDISILNMTRNAQNSLDILRTASCIYVIMGCFVEYAYFACKPPTANELADLLTETGAKIVLFYVMGTSADVDRHFIDSKLAPMVSDIEVGNTYRYVIEGPPSMRGEYLLPNYHLLERIAGAKPAILSDVIHPIIAELETGTGCNTPTCYYCIEAARRPRIQYRSASSIVLQARTLYECGVRHFRLGRQPNFYHYARKDVAELERLLAGIRTSCPDILMLHIDNVNMIDVIQPAGKAFTKLIVKYCTSGNIGPFGIESFDGAVRKDCGIVGSAEDVLEAISIINDHGSERGLDGLPKFLPGINLIYGLRGQRESTHEINMAYLNKILRKGLMTRRLFYRRLTRSTGITFGVEASDDEEIYLRNLRQITEEFVLPMQSKVYPTGGVVKGLMEIRNDADAAYMRTYGTCSERYRINGPQQRRGYSYDIRIVGNAGYRLIDGVIIGKRALPA